MMIFDECKVSLTWPGQVFSAQTCHCASPFTYFETCADMTVAARNTVMPQKFRVSMRLKVELLP